MHGFFKKLGEAIRPSDMSLVLIDHTRHQVEFDVIDADDEVYRSAVLITKDDRSNLVRVKFDDITFTVEENITVIGALLVSPDL